jgi:hypothetical protein
MSGPEDVAGGRRPFLPAPTEPPSAPSSAAERSAVGNVRAVSGELQGLRPEPALGPAGARVTRFGATTPAAGTAVDDAEVACRYLEDRALNRASRGGAPTLKDFERLDKGRSAHRKDDRSYKGYLTDRFDPETLRRIQALAPDRAGFLALEEILKERGIADTGAIRRRLDPLR